MTLVFEAELLKLFRLTKKKFVLTHFNLGYLHINQEDKSEQHIESIRELDLIAL